MIEISFTGKNLAEIKNQVKDLFPEQKTITQIVEESKEIKPGFLTLNDLVYHSMNDYDQYLGCHADCLEIATEIKNKTWSSGKAKIDERFVYYAIKNDIATTLCNVNTRILLINNYLERNGKKPIDFKTAYKKILSGQGLQSGTITTIIDRLAFYANFGILEDEIVRTTSNNIKTHFEEGRVFAIRIENEDGSKGHTTMAFCSHSRLIAVDTASGDRTGKDITSNVLTGKLYNRIVKWIEYLI